jgi:hypothetical protein
MNDDNFYDWLSMIVIFVVGAMFLFFHYAP